MQSSVLQGILLPFWGTSLGAACVFCLRRAPSAVLRRVLEGFAAGVMTAASVWSLLLPAIDWADMGRWSFLPAAGGFCRERTGHRRIRHGLILLGGDVKERETRSRATFKQSYSIS